MEKKTSLYDTHVKAGGKIVPFAGYLLPVQYEGVIAEHMAVRERAGLFDVSHMGEFTLTGKDALKNVQNLVTNNCDPMYNGQIKYTPMCNHQGGVVDDLLVYKTGDESYMLVVNAANKEKDFNWIEKHLEGDVKLQDISDEIAQIALQGPAADKIIRALVAEEDIPTKYYSFKDDVEVAGVRGIISRTGYTGEDGFELYVSAKDAPDVWERLMEEGKDDGLVPCGLGARDTLRLEAAMPLYGHEMDDTVSPREMGIGFFVKMDKESFIGKDALVAKGVPTVKRVGLKIIDRGIVREHCDVMVDGHIIGTTTSGTYCPYLGAAYAMAIIPKEYSEVGSIVDIQVRKRVLKAEIVKLPFYKKSK